MNVGAAAPAPGQETDDALVGFLAGVELAAVTLYAGAGPSLGSPAATRAAAAFAAHHLAHAEALSGLGGGATPAPGPNQAVLADMAPALAAVRTEAEALAFVRKIEGQLAATYQHGLTRMTGVVALQLCASILPVEVEHAVVWGTLLGRPLVEVVPTFQREDGFLDPAKYGNG